MPWQYKYLMSFQRLYRSLGQILGTGATCLACMQNGYLHSWAKRSLSCSSDTAVRSLLCSMDFFCILGRLDQDSIVCRYFLSEAPVWLKFSRHCWPIRRPSSNHHLVKSFQYTIVHGLSLQSLKRIRCQCCRSPLHCYQLKSEHIPFLGPRLCEFRLLCSGHSVS